MAYKESPAPETTSGAGPANSTATEDNPQFTLSVPHLDEDAGTLEAALAYAADGWYIGPTEPRSKSPGSVLGTNWQTKTSRDHEVITAWFAGTDYGLFLHCGRSGAIVFDADHPERMPALLRKATAQADPPFQSTRTDEPARGHYVFAVPPGHAFGNGTGNLGKGWGEVRGQNGIIIVQPSEHPGKEGRYRWLSHGPVPLLPDVLVAALPQHEEAVDAATDETVHAFLAHDYSDATRDDLGLVHVRSLETKIKAGQSRHDSTVGAVVGLLKDAHAGLVDPGNYLDTVQQLFLGAVTQPGHGQQGEARTRSQAGSEWRGILAWAVAQAEASDGDAHRARVAALFPPEVDEDAEMAFWRSSDVLSTIFDFALARLTSPWAVLGVVLVRVADTVPYGVLLPAIVGGKTGLNTFVALVAPSGGGKGAAERVAEEVVDLGGHTPFTASPGSGEGAIAAYLKMEKTKGVSRPVRCRDAVIFTLPEVDVLTAVSGRSGSTILGHLRELWSGEKAESFTADPSKARSVAAGTYRCGVVLGVQPRRAAALFEGESEAGGTPQRFLWMPATDPRVGEVEPEEPEPYRLPVQQWHWRHDLTVPDEVRTVIKEAYKARQRGDVDALDGHALLARERAAQLLCILEGRRVMTSEDWQRSGTLMAVSDRTRGGIKRELRSAAEARAETAGRFDAIRSEAAEQTLREGAVPRVAQALRRKITADGIKRSTLRRALASYDRTYFDDALDRLVDVGDVTVTEQANGAQVISLTGGQA